MPDEAEPYCRQRLVEINALPGTREALEAEHGQVWKFGMLPSECRANSDPPPNRSWHQGTRAPTTVEPEPNDQIPQDPDVQNRDDDACRPRLVK